MTTALAEPDLDLQEQEEEDDLEHIVCCCDRNLAMCGEDVTGQGLNEADWDEDDDTCPKCIALVEHPCILCGYSLYDRDCACGKCWVWDLPGWQQNILRNTSPHLFI